MRVNSKNVRIDPEFEKWARDICKQRYIRGIDKEELKLPRLTKAIVRVPNLKKILEDARIDARK